MVKLEGYKVSALDFINKIEKDGDIKLEIKCSYTVNYSESSDSCIGICGITIKDSGDDFVFNLEVQGKFGIPVDGEKKEIHKESFSQLYSVAKGMVSLITANIGLPPINLPNADLGEIVEQEPSN